MGAVATAVLLVAACSLESGGMGSDARPVTPTALDAASSPEASSPVVDAGGPATDADAEAPLPDDAGPDATTPAPPDCDVDRDGYLAPSCGGNDCCDTDALAHEGAKDFYGAKNACGSFDYDCDGAASPEFGAVACKLGFFECTGSGFAFDVPCGAPGEFVSCAFRLACVEERSLATQRCR